MATSSRSLTPYPTVDAATYAANSIDYAHHEIHGGSAFAVHYENLCTNTNEMSVIAFNTPDTTKWLHLIATGFVTAIARLAIYENPSIDVGEGTQLTIYNRNRNSSTTSGVTSIEASPVANKATSFNEVQAAGANITKTTKLASTVVGVAGGPGGSGIGGGAQASGRFEWILKQNQQYAFVIESLSDDDNYHTIELNWYEHTNK